MGDDDFADRTVTDLKVLAMVQKGCKLAVRKGQLAIDEPGYARFLWRWMRHDCRDLTLLHVRSSVNGALALLARDAADRRRFLEEFRGARKGLENLRVTYASDSVMVASLDVLLEKLQRACERLERDAQTPEQEKA